MEGIWKWVGKPSHHTRVYGSLCTCMQASLLFSFLFGIAKDLNIVNFAGQPAGQEPVKN